MRSKSGLSEEFSTCGRPPWLTLRRMSCVLTRSLSIIFERIWRLKRRLTTEERQILLPSSKRDNKMMQEKTKKKKSPYSIQVPGPKYFHEEGDKGKGKGTGSFLLSSRLTMRRYPISITGMRIMMST